MFSNYSVFDYLESPVAVFDPSGSTVYYNTAYSRKIMDSLPDAGTDRKDCVSGLVFVSEKGVVKCYLISKDKDNHSNNICIFNDITPFVSRKSMTEIIAAERDEHNDYAMRKIIEKNTRMAGLIDTLESGILVEGSSGNLIQVNNSFLKMISSMVITELPEKSYDADFYHRILSELCTCPNYMQQKDAIVRDYQSGVYTDELEFKDGRTYRRTFRQLYVGDTPKGYLWKFKDITVRKALESFNIELEANLRALESCETVGLFMEYSGYRFANRGLEKLLGTPQTVLLGDGLGGIIPGNIFTTEERGAVESTMRFNDAHGRESFLSVTSDCLNISGKPAHIITVKDITDNTLLQRDIEISESRFRSIFEKNLAVMLILDAENLHIINANQSALDFYGLSYKELVDMHMCDITIVESMDSCMTSLQSMVEQQKGMRVSVSQRVADGEHRRVELLMTPIGGDGSGLIFVIVDDVHDRVKYENELENLNRNLMKMVEAEADKRRRQEELLMEKSRLAEMGEMIGNIAHQWRQPLNALGLIIQDLEDASAHGELNSDYLDNVISEGMNQINYMSKTIDDFRDFFKPSTRETVFDVKENIGQVLSIFLPQIRNSCINLAVHCECTDGSASDVNTDKLTICGCHDVRIKGYANQFKQVLLNILSNSKHAVLSSAEKNIDIYIEATENIVRVSVKDSGGGIPEDIIGRIFDPYFTTKAENEGTGIGLYMSKAIVEDNLGGSLTAVNTDGGCLITIEVDRVTC